MNASQHSAAHGHVNGHDTIKKAAAKGKAKIAKAIDTAFPNTEERKPGTPFSMLNDVPSSRRLIVSSVIALFTYATSYYVGMQATVALVAAASVLTTSPFLLYMVAFIGLFITFIAAWWLGGKAFDLASEFDIKKLKARVVNVRDRFDAWRAARAEAVRRQAIDDMETELRGGV